MSCNEEFKTLLSRYVDGELSPEERSKVDEHISSCEGCRELLGLFRKNENLLAGALSTEAFGEAVIESVVRKIGREAVPENAGVMDGLRARPWLPMAAAALVAVGVFALLHLSHSSQIAELRRLVKGADDRAVAAEQKNVRLAADLQGEMQQSGSVAAEFRKYRQEQETTEMIRKAGTGFIIGYVEVDHYLEVKASFDPRSFTGYNVYRREAPERDDRYVVLNAKPLQKPEYTDRSAKQGHTYVYKFQALRPNLDPVESAPMTIKLPFAGDLPPEKCVRIHCEDLAAPKDNGVFRLERLVNGRPVSHRFYVKLGDQLGSRVQVPGVGWVDFTTDLTLAKIEDGTEDLKVNLTGPVLDSEGQPLVEKVVDGLFVPVTREYEQSFGTRPSKKAWLRPIASTDPKGEPLWKDSWMRVRAHGE